MTAALLRWWTVPRLNTHLNPSSTGESSTAKKVSFTFPHVLMEVPIELVQLVTVHSFLGSSVEYLQMWKVSIIKPGYIINKEQSGLKS